MEDVPASVCQAEPCHSPGWPVGCCGLIGDGAEWWELPAPALLRHQSVLFNKYFYLPDTKNTAVSLLNKRCWEDWISTSERMKLDPYLTPYTNSTLKETKDLNV